MPARPFRISIGLAARAMGSAAFALGVLLLAGCAVPPPGAFFEWSVVKPIAFSPDRPLVALQTRWEDFLQGTPADAADCGPDACLADPPAWVVRCVKPRAESFARASTVGLASPGSGHAQGFSMLARQLGVVEVATTAVVPACSPSWQSAAAAAGVVQAILAQAAEAAPPDCSAVPRATLEVEVLVLDRARQSLGDFIVHDLPAIFGSTLGSFASLGTVTALGDLVHRVVVLTLTVERDGAAPVQVSGRGAAGVGVGSLKMADRQTPVPPALVGVAFGEALRQLDAALAAAAAPACPAAVSRPRVRRQRVPAAPVRPPIRPARRPARWPRYRAASAAVLA